MNNQKHNVLRFPDANDRKIKDTSTSSANESADSSPKGEVIKDRFSYKIERHVGALSERDAKGMQLELNLVSFHGKRAKWDIRRWNKNHTKMGEGITLGDGELGELAQAIWSIYDEYEEDDPDDDLF